VSDCNEDKVRSLAPDIKFRMFYLRLNTDMGLHND
jgi:hypothetical protein